MCVGMLDALGEVWGSPVPKRARTTNDYAMGGAYCVVNLPASGAKLDSKARIC